LSLDWVLNQSCSTIVTKSCRIGNRLASGCVGLREGSESTRREYAKGGRTKRKTKKEDEEGKKTEEKKGKKVKSNVS